MVMTQTFTESYDEMLREAELIDTVAHLEFGQGEDNTFVGSFRRLLQSQGKDVPYWYLMGVCGAAFRIQIHRNSWRMNSPDLICGFELTDYLFNAFGMEYERIWVCGDQEKISYARNALSRSLDKSIPAIGLGLDGKSYHGIVIGRQPTGAFMALDYSLPGYPHAVAEKMVWCYHVVTDSRPLLTEREQLIQGLGLARQFLTQTRAKSFHLGLDAYEYWYSTLVNPQHHNPYEDDWRAKDRNNGNYWIFINLLDARIAAGRFCRDAAQRFPACAENLKKLAEIYESITTILKPFIMHKVIRPDTKISRAWPWTLHQRRKQAKCLLEIKALEETGLPIIDDILGMLNSE